MFIEVWSDIACPFCYLGKKRLEKAIQDFEYGDRVEIIWKSYQLDPDLQTEGTRSIYEYLEEERGYDVQQLQRSNQHLTEKGKELGIEFDFEDIVVANTFHAHILLQYSRSQGLQLAMKDRLMRAYFTEGKNVGDKETLLDLAEDVRLDRDACEKALRSGDHGEQVRMDAYEAHQLGARGVPFFVFNDKYIVRGAQEQAIFDGALRKAFSEWKRGTGN